MRKIKLCLTHHIRFGLMPLPFGTLLPEVATSYMPRTLGEIHNGKGEGKYEKT